MVLDFLNGEVMTINSDEAKKVFIKEFKLDLNTVYTTEVHGRHLICVRLPEDMDEEITDSTLHEMASRLSYNLGLKIEFHAVSLNDGKPELEFRVVDT